MTDPVAPASAEDVKRLKRLAEKATWGPWAVESCGEKGDGSDMIGVVYGPDDVNAERPLSGRLPAFDGDGNEIEYYRDELVAECEHRNRNSGQNSAYIAALHPAALLSLIAWGEAAERKFAEVLPDLNDLDAVVHDLHVEDREITPAEAVAELHATIEAERARAAQAEKERDEARAHAESMRINAYAAVNPSNWQRPHTDKECLTTFEKTLTDISRRDTFSGTLEKLVMPAFERAAQAEAGMREMAGALSKAAETFREYERLHLAKGTHDGRMKADKNAALAEIMEAALAFPTAAVALAEREVVEAAVERLAAMTAFRKAYAADGLYSTDTLAAFDRRGVADKRVREVTEKLLAARAAKDEGPGAECAPTSDQRNQHVASPADIAQGAFATPPAADKGGERHEFVEGRVGPDNRSVSGCAHPACELPRNHPVHTGGE